MANLRSTFAKRQRELNLKDKADAKKARRAAKRHVPRTEKGPPIAWDTPAPGSAGDSTMPDASMSDDMGDDDDAGEGGGDEAAG